MFWLTEDQRSIQEMVRDFAEKEIAPHAEEFDKENKYPSAPIAGLAEMGIMGLNIPEEYGGADMDEVSKVLVISEVGRCCGGTGEILATQPLVNDIILKNANEEQKRTYLPLVAEGQAGRLCAD